MGEPTLYFPENVYYRIGLTEGRQWSTNALDSPSGRVQRRKLWIRPKRQMQAIIYPTVLRGLILNYPPYGNNDPGAPPPKLADDDMFGLQIRPFLDQVAGRYRSFYIFDPVPHMFYYMPVGGWNGGGNPLPVAYPSCVPFIFPFRGAWDGLSNAQPANVISVIFIPVGGGPPLVFEPEDFGITTAPTLGRETYLAAFSPPIRTPPDAGDYYMYVSVSGAHERIPAVMVDDRDDFAFDWANARQPSQLVVNIEEDFG